MELSKASSWWLWRRCCPVLVVCCCLSWLPLLPLAGGFNVTFEEKEGVEEWRAHSVSPFDISMGKDFYHDYRFPAVDATLGTPEGHFVVAVGFADGGVNRFLYSVCLNPTGPRCALHFDTWMPPPPPPPPEGEGGGGGKEELYLSTMTFCHFCSNGLLAKEFRELPYVVTNQQASSGEDDGGEGYGGGADGLVTRGGWRHHRVELKALHSFFVLALIAYVPDNDSVVAVDNIYLDSCALDEERDVCGEGQFKCPHTTQCIPRHKVCDLVNDCYCAEDESLAQCEKLPSEARAQFEDCDLDSGQCFWYNVPDPSGHTLPWKLTSADRANRSVAQLHFGNCSGTFAHVTALTTQSQWTSHFLRSVDFPPLPAGDSSCALRFQYWLSGHTQLTVHVQQLGDSALRALWRSPAAPAMPRWVHVIVPINTVPMPNRYVLQLSASVEKGYRKSNAAVANLTMSPDCFLPLQEVLLTPCGNQGPEGPSPEQCARHYRPSPSPNVTVLTHPHPLSGAQLWTVGSSGKYSLQAYGARGGRDREGTDSELTHGSHVQATFLLRQGDTLAVLVGQRGQDSPQMNLTNQAWSRNITTPPSGGGGGGATFVFRIVKDQEPELLMMAGGGGGMDYVSFADNNSAEGERPWQETWETEEKLGWVLEESREGGDFSGRGCPGNNASTPPLAAGGFGAGHGACSKAGGHGGGTDVRTAKGSVQYAGWPGSVYVHSERLSATFHFRSHPDHGALRVQPVSWGCPCDFLCLWTHPDRLGGGRGEGAERGPSPGSPGSRQQHESEEEEVAEAAFRCICPAGTVLAADGLTCVVPEPEVDDPDPIVGGPLREDRGRSAHGMPVETAVIVSISAIIALIILVVVFFVYVMRSSPQDRLWSLRQVLTRCLRNRSQSLPLHNLPASALPARVLHINPNYSFIANKVSDTKLPEIPRDNLRMATQLGCGAFGEVYKGFLSGMSGTEREVAVAVKTLPPLCSEQTELDFFMEAYIISKFHHPNIVHFLGVCFEQHPRYIVLELLDGGNLKSFLRENRPSEGQMSKLSVRDLISLARDVCCGCCYLEEHHFIHRDIAARNCLLTTKGPERVAKIADFGMSRDVYRADYYKKEGRALLPLKWMPPEAFMEGMFTTKTDVWSYGVVLWEIFAMGYMPYPALSNTEVMNFIYIGGRLHCPDGCPSPVYDLMLSCWKHKSEERPTFRSIKLTLDTLSQDTATMSQHIPPFRLPHMHNGCSGRNLMLLNHPVPALGLTLQDPSPPPSSALLTSSSSTTSSSTSSSEPSCQEPLLLKSSAAAYKQTFPRRGGGGVGDGVGLAPFVESDSFSGKGSCSSLEPLLPLDVQSLSDWEAGPEEGGTLGGGAAECELDALMEKERRAGQRVKLPPGGGGPRGERLKSLSSLSTLEEMDEVMCDEEKNATV
ncbi:ALK tyrosine kinase receptor-like isoform X2 [Babylonia areolata]|uniref:ALK tyrosine kinase receptor-like isoform X2 n=1 Tax=Babylonia areolata TaxID=304850 RepID=UPI003FD66B4A